MVKFTCDPRTVTSNADNKLLHCLVNGLVDKDIGNLVMVKVDILDFETTIKFIWAKEAEKKCDDYMDSGMLMLGR